MKPIEAYNIIINEVNKVGDFPAEEERAIKEALSQADNVELTIRHRGRLPYFVAYLDDDQRIEIRP